MAQTCPRDGVVLTPQKDLLGPGTTGHVCPKCSGVLVAWDQAQGFFGALGLPLEDLQVAVAKFKARPRPGATAPAPCTSCGKGQLSGFLHQGVELDLCTECGAAWFDRGELARVSKGKFGAGLADAPKAMEGETVREEGVYEMLWDCGHCDVKALLAKSNRCCPNCGAQQDASRRYFPPPGQEVKANAEYDGADASCPACNTPNGAKAKNCRSCGSPMDGSAKVATVADRVDRAPQAAAAPKKGTPMWVWGVAAAAVLMCGMCGVATMWTKASKATVAGHHWTREIEIESMEPRQDSAWCDSLPSGAYDISRSKEQRSTKKIEDGETCGTRDVDRGDGTFKRVKECKPKYREEPVYDEKCRYTIDRWGKERTVKAKGDSLNDAPQWPRVNLSRTGTCRGCEREGSRTAKYTVDLKGPKGESWDCDVDESKWRGLSVGTERDVKVRVMGGGVDCSSL